MYAIIDRRSWKVIAKSSRKSSLPKKATGLLVDTAHLERLHKDEVFALYEHVAHGEPVPPWVVEQIRRAIENNNNNAAKASKPPGKGASKATPEKTGDAPETLGPVAIVRRICNEMKGSARKDVVAACVAAGINENTAKTQYQRWFSAQK